MIAIDNTLHKEVIKNVAYWPGAMRGAAHVGKYLGASVGRKNHTQEYSFSSPHFQLLKLVKEEIPILTTERKCSRKKSYSRV